MKLSVIIPSYKDPYLQKTIDSLLHRPGLGSQIEVIVVLDGYWPETPLKDNPRLRIVHLGKNSGMREAINAGVRVARGEYIMRTDEHCLFAYGYAKTMTDDCQDNWIMTPIRYYLDPVKWQVMKREPVVYEKLGIQSVGGKKKFCGLSWKEREKERKDILVDETMAMQGSCWLMKKSWWDKTIKKLDSEHYGTHYQDSHEMIFKTWQAGGKLMVNKKTWFAHKYYKFPRSHNYGSQTGDPKIQYCYDIYKDYYKNKIKPKWKI
jgi:glycosyltransferase involved in cell wall biosynthesis